MKQSPDYLNVSEPKTTLHTFTVFPENLNYGGTLFGGKVLAEMDIAAVNTARRVLYNLDYDTKGKTTLICEAKFTFVVLKNGKALPHNLVLSGEIIPKPSEN